MWTVLRIGAEKFVNDHHKGRTESDGKSIVEEILLRPELEHLGLSRLVLGMGTGHRVIHTDVAEKGC